MDEDRVEDIYQSWGAREMAERIVELEAADPARMVAEFHAAMGDAPGALGRPFPDPEVEDLRFQLLDEEFGEYFQAVMKRDMTAIADALGDMAYVIFGTAHVYGVDLLAVLAEIHRSNMTKDFVKGGKAKKGERYERPDIAGVLSA